MRVDAVHRQFSEEAKLGMMEEVRGEEAVAMIGELPVCAAQGAIEKDTE